MDLQAASILFGAGVVGGGLAGLVGGASLITFPVLLAAGLSPVTAAASNLAAIAPANFIAAWTDRSRMPPVDRAFVGLMVSSVLGALIGAALLMLTPTRAFELLVPVLLGFATVLLAFSVRISNWIRASARARGKQDLTLSITSIPVMLPVSVYGGYFGAGVGVMLLGVLSVVTGGDYRSANVIKNIVTGLNTLVAVTCFGIFGAVSWRAAFVMGAGALLGGLLGGHAARIVSPAAMRIAVVALGALLTVVYAWRYWF
jgi:uncharacterized membrane protein YfcA